MILGAANDNQKSMTKHIDATLASISNSNGPAGTATAKGNGNVTTLDPTLTQLVSIVSMNDYLEALDSLAPQIHADNQVAAVFSSLQFADSMLSCAAKDGAYRFVREDQCVWFRMGGRTFERDRSTQNRAFGQTSYQIAGGGQFELGDDWIIGAAGSWESQNLSVEDLGKSNGDLFQGGVVVKKRFGATMLSASLSGGGGSYDFDRTLFTGDISSGTQDLWVISGQISASHTFERANWYAKPRVDVGFDHVTMDAFSEAGAGGASLIIGKSSDTYFNVQPSIEFGGEIALDNGVLIRPNVTVGITQFLGDTDPTVTARFVSSPTNVTSFTTTSQLDNTFLDIGAGVDIFATERMSISLNGFGQFSDNTHNYGGSAKLAIRF